MNRSASGGSIRSELLSLLCVRIGVKPAAEAATSAAASTAAADAACVWVTAPSLCVIANRHTTVYLYLHDIMIMIVLVFNICSNFF